MTPNFVEYYFKSRCYVLYPFECKKKAPIAICETLIKDIALQTTIIGDKISEVKYIKSKDSFLVCEKF